MAFLYFDDSKHHPHGFSLGASETYLEDPVRDESKLRRRGTCHDQASLALWARALAPVKLTVAC